MKKAPPLALRIGAMLAAWPTLLAAQGGGPLTPPGPPAPVYKTLAQMTPGIPIPTVDPSHGQLAAPPYVITRPGSFYLTENLVGDGAGPIIEVAFPRGTRGTVSIDLKGYTIKGSGETIGIKGAHSVANGRLVGPLGTAVVSGQRAARLTIEGTNNGIAYFGMVMDCQFRAIEENAVTGVDMVVRCQVHDGTVRTGAGAIVADCSIHQPTGRPSIISGGHSVIAGNTIRYESQQNGTDPAIAWEQTREDDNGNLLVAENTLHNPPAVGIASGRMALTADNLVVNAGSDAFTGEGGLWVENGASGVGGDGLRSTAGFNAVFDFKASGAGVGIHLVDNDNVPCPKNLVVRADLQGFSRGFDSGPFSGVHDVLAIGGGQAVSRAFATGHTSLVRDSRFAEFSRPSEVSYRTVIAGCTFSAFDSRGIVLDNEDVYSVVQDCHFDRIEGAAILAAVPSFIATRNIFSSCGEAFAISSDSRGSILTRNMAIGLAGTFIGHDPASNRIGTIVPGSTLHLLESANSNLQQ